MFEPARDKTERTSAAFAPRPATVSRIRQWAVRLLPLALAALLLYSLHRQFASAATALRGVRPVAFVSLALFFCWNHIATLSWQALLRGVGVKSRSLAGLVRLRIEAQAVNQLLPTAGVAGEALRAVSAGGRRELGNASLATALDNAAGTASGLVFAMGALALYLLEAHEGDARLRALLLVVTAALIVLLVVVALPFSLSTHLLPRLSPTGRLRSIIEPLLPRRREILEALRAAVGFRFGERLLAVGEVYVLFHAVGAPVSLSVAALISAVLVLVSFVAVFLPGQLGAAEAAVASASALLGLPPALGLSAALLRRIRQLFVCALGVVSLLIRRHRQPRPPALTTEAP
jgi:uncharacterized membrane protein YbhN (UPF0104 family)